MTELKKYLPYLLLLFLAYGCRSKKTVSEHSKEVQIDTIVKTQKVVDTVFRDRIVEKTKPVYFETEIPCDSNQSGKIASGNNFTRYEIKNGRVYLKTNIDSVSNYWQSYYKTKYVNDSINIRKDTQKDSKSVSVTKVYVYPWWIYALIVGVVLFAGLWVYTKFFTPF